MSKQPNYSPTSPVSDAFGDLIDRIARFLFWAGAALVLLSVGILVVQFQATTGSTPNFNAAQAKANIDLFGKLMIGGVVALFVGSTYVFWGEEILGAIQLLGAGVLYFATPFVPGMVGGATPTEVGEAALSAIRNGGLVLGLLAVCCLGADLTVRARSRVRQGAKADQLKYGKGVKEERDIQNVFLGKCWQLPFCRKFVREKCPIYHSNRTCWREQVGCMCEESVIQNAMEGRIVPKDAVAAAKMIPVNNKLTPAQKFERCKSCIIYNEHQKHKYKIGLPITVAIMVGIWMLIRVSGMHLIEGAIEGMDRMVGRLTFSAGGGVEKSISQSSVPFQEIVLVCLMVVLFAYALKLLEFLIFKAKI